MKIKAKRIFNLYNLAIVACIILVVVSLIIIFTNPLHHLFCKFYSVNVTDAVLGPYFYVHLVYTYALMLFSFFKIVKTSVQKAGFLSFGTILIVIGACAPIIPSFLSSLQIIAIEAYTTAILYLITAVCFYISIFKLNSFDAVPIALKNIVDIMTDAFIVVEKDGTITYCNKPFLDYLSNFMKIGLNDNFYTAIQSNKKLNLSNLENDMKQIQTSRRLVLYDWNFVYKNME